MESQMSAPKRNMTVKLDPRTQLIAVGSAGLAVAFCPPVGALLLTGALAAYAALQGYARQGAGFLAVAALLFGGHQAAAASPGNLSGFLIFIFGLLLRLVPVALSAYPLSRVPAGRLMAALQRWKLPPGLLIALVVGLRFIPMLRLEYEAVQTSVRLRGLSAGRLSNWRRPLRMFEYRIVPLMVRSLKIADELAASASIRGMEAPGRRSSVYAVRMNGFDYAALLAIAGLSVWGLAWNMGG